MKYLKTLKYLKLFYSLTLITIFFTACKKDRDSNCTVNKTAPAQEIAELSNYIKSNNIQAEKDSRGFYYHIEEAGSSKRPDACSSVEVDYHGKLISGAIFDQAEGQVFNLSTLIPGWQEGLPLIGEGGRVILYIPPALGYGNSGTGPIPPNSIIIFDIYLKQVYD